jgi:hypothetical protein
MPQLLYAVAEEVDGKRGYDELAERVRSAIVELARGAGFWEHYSPTTGEGHGGGEFAWTAALVLDLLRDDGDDTRREALA